MKFTFKTLSDPSKFLSQKNKHMRAELVNSAPPEKTRHLQKKKLKDHNQCMQGHAHIIK